MRVRILREAHDDIKAVVAVLDCRRDPLLVAQRLSR